MVIGAVVTGAVLVVGADPIVAALADVLPTAATAHGAGTSFPRFEDAAPFALKALGIALMAAPVMAAVLRRWLPSLFEDTGHADEIVSRRSRWAVAAVLALISFGVYLWYAYPPNMFPGNARIHWVDIFFTRSDDYFYTLVKLPHHVFYDVPHLWQALNGALNVVLIYFIGRRLFPRSHTAILMALSFLGSTMMLLFANTAEDVHLSITTLLVVVLAHLARLHVWVGAAIFLAVLARPPFGAFLGTLVISEVVLEVVQERRAGWRACTEKIRGNRFLWTNVGSFLLLFAVWNVVLTSHGANWVLGDSVATQLLNVEPIEVDGFSISPLSGAYVFHLLWIFSPVLLLGATVVVVRVHRLPDHLARTVLAGALFVAFTIGLSEFRPLLYFNVRYLAYVWPIVLVLAWTVLRLPWRSAHSAIATGVAVLLTVAPATPFRQDLEQRASYADHPYSRLFDDRHELRRLTAGYDIATTFTARSKRNYIAYLLKRPIASIGVVDGDALPEDTVVVTDSIGSFPESSIVFEGDGTVFILLSATEAGR